MASRQRSGKAERVDNILHAGNKNEAFGAKDMRSDTGLEVPGKERRQVGRV